MDERIESQRRPCLRFRFRSLLLLIVVVALPVAGLSEQERRQRNAVATVRKYGIVWYQEPSEQFGVGAIQVWIAKLLGDDFAYRVVRVRVEADMTDDFTALNDLAHIDSADVGGYTLSGALLADILTRMPKLRELWIWNPGGLTGADMLCLRRSPQLNRLSLLTRSEQRAGDLVREVSQLINLRSLYVDCPRLTATMVQYLARATALEELAIATLYKSPAETQRLRNALPCCKVVECDTY